MTTRTPQTYRPDRVWNEMVAALLQVVTNPGMDPETQIKTALVDIGGISPESVRATDEAAEIAEHGGRLVGKPRKPRDDLGARFISEEEDENPTGVIR